MGCFKGVGIGAGYFARFQYEAWTRIPELEIAAVCDRSEDKARGMMQEFGIPRYYSDWRAMIDEEKPDFVDIITPPDTHEEICAHAAARGVHIISQKPLAPDLEGCRRIVANARSDLRPMSSAMCSLPPSSSGCTSRPPAEITIERWPAATRAAAISRVDRSTPPLCRAGSSWTTVRRRKAGPATQSFRT